MSRIRLLAVVAAPALLVASVSTAQHGSIREMAPPLPEQSRDFKEGAYRGRVTAVSDRSITIDGVGIDRVGPVNRLAGQRRFVVSELLAAGGYNRAAGFESHTYRLADVRVGDKVDIRYDRVRNVDICTDICIERRPSGRVPPSQQAAHAKSPWHEFANAYQDWEERGIPLPARFQPLPDLERPRSPDQPDGGDKALRQIPLAR